MAITTGQEAAGWTGSSTLADLTPLAARAFGSHPALHSKEGDEWVDVSFTELELIVRESALGLRALGIEAGDRVAIVSHTRREWTFANLATLSLGAVSVSVYQTNSADEVRYVLGHAEARAVFVEDLEQLAKVREVAADLPHLEQVIVLAPDGELGDAISLDQLRELGAHPGGEAEFEAIVASVDPEDTAVIIYTSGTTGPPKGCILTHANLRSVVTQVEDHGVIDGPEVIYLYLPLAHAYALVIQFVLLDVGGTIAYWERDPEKIVPNLAEVQPTYFPSVPRLFEKIHTTASAKVAERGGYRARLFWWSIETGKRVRELERSGRRPGPALRARHRVADRLILSKVRALFGGRVGRALTGAAPTAVDIIRFFDACGIRMLEAYGMTETCAATSLNTLDHVRFGSVGRPLPGMEVRIADDGELLLRGPNVFQGYHRDPQATAETLRDGWLHTGDIGHLDEDGFLYVTGRKKDIIITAGGKNLTPANLEHELKSSRWVSQAVVLGDGRPYLVALLTLDPDEAPAFAERHGLDVQALPDSGAMRDELERVVGETNRRVGRAAQIKRFAILPHDLSQERGELTPTLKVKRGVVSEKYRDEIDRLYA